MLKPHRSVASAAARKEEAALGVQVTTLESRAHEEQPRQPLARQLVRPLLPAVVRVAGEEQVHARLKVHGEDAGVDCLVVGHDGDGEGGRVALPECARCLRGLAQKVLEGAGGPVSEQEQAGARFGVDARSGPDGRVGRLEETCRQRRINLRGVLRACRFLFCVAQRQRLQLLTPADLDDGVARAPCLKSSQDEQARDHQGKRN
eukprot:scaffold10651_cov112-Isochrysis_galbana.AAC.8